MYLMYGEGLCVSVCIYVLYGEGVLLEQQEISLVGHRDMSTNMTYDGS